MKNRVPKYEEKIREVIRIVVKEIGTHPFDINNGDCEEFAYKVCKILPEIKIEYTDIGEIGHVFLYWNKRYYDAEELMGVKDYHDLPIFNRHKLLEENKA